MLTWFFTFFGIGAGIAVLVFLAGVVGVLAWFLVRAVQSFGQGIRQGMEEERARKAAKERRQG